MERFKPGQLVRMGAHGGLLAEVVRRSELRAYEYVLKPKWDPADPFWWRISGRPFHVAAEVKLVPADVTSDATKKRTQ